MINSSERYMLYEFCNFSVSLKFLRTKSFLKTKRKIAKKDNGFLLWTLSCLECCLKLLSLYWCKSKDAASIEKGRGERVLMLTFSTSPESCSMHVLLFRGLFVLFFNGLNSLSPDFNFLLLKIFCLNWYTFARLHASG